MKILVETLAILCCTITPKSELINMYKDTSKQVLKEYTELQVIDENAVYFNSKGEVKQGIVEDQYKESLNNYLDNDYYVFATNKNGDIYYVDNDGVIETGLIKIDNDTYYFNELGVMQKGIVEIDGKTYPFDLNSGKLQYGFFTNENGTYYIDNDGVMKIGFADIDGERYYFNEEGLMQRGIISVNNQNYLLNNEGKLQYGFTYFNGSLYYTIDGIIQTGLVTIGSDKYYFSNDGVMLTGWQTIDGFEYYFNSNGKMARGVITMGNKEYHFSDSGALEYVVNLPVYYSQKDARWGSTMYGEKNIAATGCGPTSLAMIFSSLTGSYITPTSVANYLYNNTNEFNKETEGMSGLGIVYAANAFGVSYRGVSSLDQLNNELSQGKMILAVVGGGHFVRSGYTHSIVLFNSNGKTVVYNPNPTYGGKVTTSPATIWSELSSDPYDLKGGYVVYAFG